MRNDFWPWVRLGVPKRRARNQRTAKLPAPYQRFERTLEPLEQRLLLSGTPQIQLNAPNTNYTATWSKAGAVDITGATAQASLVSGLSNPVGIAVSGGNLYVTNATSGAIGEYNATTGAPVKASLVTGLNEPLGIVVSGTNLYVTNATSGTIGEYNATTGATVNASLVSGLNQPLGIAVSGANLYVVNNSTGTIGEYDATSGAPVNTALVSGLGGPTGIAVSGADLFVANKTSNTIGEYDATSGMPVNASLVSGLNYPAGIAVSGADLVVVNRNTGTIGEYTTSGVVNAALVSGLKNPTGIAVSGTDLYVASIGGTIGEYNSNVSITDGESTTLSSLTVTLANPHAGDVLSATGVGSVTVTPYNATTGVLLLSGTDTLANYQTVLSTVQYNNTAGGPGISSETINVQANDGTAASNVAMATIAISVPPVVQLDAPSTNYATTWTNAGAVAVTVPPVNASLVSGLSNPAGIAVSGVNLFVANQTSGTIGEYNTTTVNASLVSGLSSPNGIAVSGADLFVANNGTGTIDEYNATTGAPVTIALVSGLSGPTGIAVSGGDLYVVNNGTGTIDEYDATTGAPVTIALVSGLSGPTGIVVSGSNLYVTNATIGTIDEYNATTGAPVTIALVSGLSGPSGIAVAGADLLVTNYGNGTIGEYDATTGAPVNAPLVSGLSGPYGIAESGGVLFVTNDLGGTIGEYNSNPSITDGESSTLTSITVTLTTHQANDILTATGTTSGSGTVTVTPYNPSTGVLLLSGADSLADYMTVLNTVQYNNTAGGPGLSSETVDVQAIDGAAASNLAAATIAIVLPSTVAGTDVFYSLSKFDGATHSAGQTSASDDAAIDTSKSAYLPGAGNATFASVTAYSLGLNGLDVDLTVPTPTNNHAALTASDFIFKLGNNQTPSAWTTLGGANVLTVVDRPGAGVGGSDRIEILFASNAIKDTWLEVRVKGDDAAGGLDTNTGLASTYTFFYGNIPGDTGAGDTKSFSVNSTDTSAVEGHLGGGLTVTSIYDFNKDKSANSTDVSLAEGTETALVLLNISNSTPLAPDAGSDADSNGVDSNSVVSSSADGNSVVSGISDLANTTIQSATLPSVAATAIKPPEAVGPSGAAVAMLFARSALVDATIAGWLGPLDEVIGGAASDDILPDSLLAELVLDDRVLHHRTNL